MKLLVEITEDIQYITEAKEDGGKNLYIEGIFLQSSIKNRNGRVYPEEVMDKEVARYIKESVQRNTAFGELSHPNGPAINLDRVSHRITELKKDGTNYVGKALITNTPMGNIARGIMESGGKLGVSSRALGTVKPNRQGINEVQSDFRLSTAADLVSDPSGPDCWINAIMEDVEWVYDPRLGWQAVQAIEESKTAIEESVRTKTLTPERKLNLLEDYLKTISKLT